MRFSPNKLLIYLLALTLGLSACSLFKAANEQSITVNFFSDKSLDKTGENFENIIIDILAHPKDVYFLLLVDAAIRKQIYHSPKFPDHQSIYGFDLSREGKVTKLKLIEAKNSDKEYLHSREECILKAQPFYPAVKDEDNRILPSYKVIYHFMG